MQHVNTGIAVYDGVMTGIKIMRKVRSYFTKKKKQKIYKLTYLLNKSNEKTTTGSGSFYAGIICTCTRQSVVDALLCHSPDGTSIAFTYKGDIYTVPVNGGKAAQITTNAAHDTHPVWSPDGKQIAFASDRMGSMDIFVVDREGGIPKD